MRPKKSTSAATRGASSAKKARKAGSTAAKGVAKTAKPAGRAVKPRAAPAGGQPGPPSPGGDRRRNVRAKSEGESFSRAVLQSISTQIAVLDKKGKIIAVNDAWSKFMLENGGEKYLRRTGVGADYFDVCRLAGSPYADKAREALRGIRAVSDGSEPHYTLEYPCRTTAERRWFTLSVSPLLEGPGGVVITHHDITARKQAEEASDRYRAQMESVFNAIQDGIVVTDLEGNVLLVNEAQARMSGLSTAEIMTRNLASYKGQYVFSRPDGEPLPFEEWPVNQVLKGESIRNWELCAKRLDTGQDWFLSFSGEPARDAAGKPIMAVVGIHDITDRKRAERALRESEDRMAGIIDSAMDAIISVDDRQRVVLFNAAAERMFGYSAAETLGQPISRLIPERFRAAHEGHIHRFSETGETTRAMGALGAVSGLRRGGEEFPIEASISQMEVEGQKLYTVILRDITARKRAEEQVVEQAAMLDQAHEAIVVRDLDNRIRYWGRGAERLYGWTAEEAVGRPAQELTYREDLRRLEETTRITIEKGKWNGELRHVTKDGREVIVEGYWTLVRDAEGRPKTIFAINTDITEKKKLEAQFLRAQRLESVGTLASGIAHDLNNILSPILMGTQMLQMRLEGEADRRLLGVMQANAERGAEMIKQVLSFAKGLGGERVLVQPKHLIREIAKVVEETFPKSIRISRRAPEGLWATSGDPTQLQQVLMNLCVNARDAMPGGGELAIEAENRELDEIYAGMLKGATPGKYVLVTVSDTGEGIPPEIIDRIFDPFFTTKEHGQGTGLGLATVQGIVTSHGGFITVESQPGRGTSFKIYLPAHETSGRKAEETGPRRLPPGRGETILVIDDEAAIREIAQTTLERFGYRALTADNGATALGIFAPRKNEISVVITDMMMPVMDGPATIRALRKLNPHVQIIASSGLAESIDDAALDQLGVKTFLIKPYDARTLLNTVALALGRGSSDS
jgi:PAS domain S-box-containing protein